MFIVVIFESDRFTQTYKNTYMYTVNSNRHTQQYILPTTWITLYLFSLRHTHTIHEQTKYTSIHSASRQS